MSALSPDNTPRFRVNYTNALGQQHTQEYRSHLSPSALGTLVDSLWTAFGNGITSTVIDDVVWAPSGSNIFNPVTTGIEGNAYGTGGAVEEKAWYYSFIGRSTGGRRVRLYFYGGLSLANDYRFVAGEDSHIDAVVALLQAAGSDLRCIDDVAPVWKTYANAGVSAYWQKRLRP